MTGLCEGGNEPSGSLKAISAHVIACSTPKVFEAVHFLYCVIYTSYLSPVVCSSPVASLVLFPFLKPNCSSSNCSSILEYKRQFNIRRRIFAECDISLTVLNSLKFLALFFFGIGSNTVSVRRRLVPLSSARDNPLRITRVICTLINSTLCNEPIMKLVRGKVRVSLKKTDSFLKIFQDQLTDRPLEIKISETTAGSDLTNSAVPASSAAEETVNTHSESTTSVMSLSSEIEGIFSTSITLRFSVPVTPKPSTSSARESKYNNNPVQEVCVPRGLQLRSAGWLVRRQKPVSSLTFVVAEIDAPSGQDNRVSTELTRFQFPRAASAAELAVKKKVNKYAHLLDNHIFVPFAVETFDPWSHDAKVLVGYLKSAKFLSPLLVIAVALLICVNA
ncbi:hypothetical protein ANN_09189 [Periplaneta americana]|uniref:Uncharacterized protein n=1 Tax=Periplaneta americana TaxID=6978 RepID=A0ABQ8TLL8_PERAM|nr:hypothetical protein ANN_09189 [Periplaneta americana]